MKREELRDRIREKLKAKRDKRAKNKINYTPPRYDDIYWQGVAWLNKQ